MRVDISQAKYYAFYYNLSLTEFLQLTPYELQLYIKSQSNKELAHWETLSYILTGRKPHKQYTLEEIDELVTHYN